MKILGISGWLQPSDTLQEIFPVLEPFRYDVFPNFAKMTESLAAENPEVVIGWSLGGVLAVQALQHPAYRPKKLVIIGSPFQYLASPEVPEGVSQQDYKTLHGYYQQDPQRLGRYLQTVINQGMPADFPLCPLAENCSEKAAWLPWLEHLAASSLHDFSYDKAARYPEVLVIYGGSDAVVSCAQGKYWSRLFPKVEVLVLSKASHAPHCQAKQEVQQAVAEFLTREDE